MKRNWRTQITNCDKPKSHRAFAISYNPDLAFAPTLSAYASGDLASLMIKTARRYGVPVRQHEKLCEQLSHSKVNQEIPKATYETVAWLFSELHKT